MILIPGIENCAMDMLKDIEKPCPGCMDDIPAFARQCRENPHETRGEEIYVRKIPCLK